MPRNFNPRPPRGERLGSAQKSPSALSFQSTPSARRATQNFNRAMQDALISIHALREESDMRGLQESVYGGYFNPRPPRGERPDSRTDCGVVVRFQSTPSARRATSRFCATVPVNIISIHALREESDSKSSEKIHHVCSIIHACAQFEKELYKGSGKMQNKSC